MKNWKKDENKERIHADHSAKIIVRDLVEKGIFLR
jgi:hypothetical protein